jgi:CDP-paratose 2-epimerase
MRMKKILVTGGCGFLGSNIAAHHLQGGWRVTVIDAMFREGCPANLAWLKSQARAGQLTHVHADLADEVAVQTAFKEHGPFDYICHLAGQVAMTVSLADPRRDFRTNALGTFNLLEAALQSSPDAFIAYSSTNKVYGDLEQLEYAEMPTRFTVPAHPDGFDESLPLDFASPYGCSKGSADQYVRDWHRNFKLKTVVFRHSTIYGGRQFATFDQGWIGWFVAQAIRQQQAHKSKQPLPRFTISGTGKQVRDVLHAEDLIRLYTAAYEHRATVAGEIFNIGGGHENSLSLLELFSILGEMLDLELVYDRLPVRQSDQKVFVANTAKAARLLGWRPQVTKTAGLKMMLEWVEKNNPGH